MGLFESPRGRDRADTNLDIELADALVIPLVDEDGSAVLISDSSQECIAAFASLFEGGVDHRDEEALHTRIGVRGELKGPDPDLFLAKDRRLDRNHDVMRDQLMRIIEAAEPPRLAQRIAKMLDHRPAECRPIDFNFLLGIESLVFSNHGG